MSDYYTSIKDVLSNTDDILWDRVVAIEYAAEEQVYDIEVEGTHNFIGNDIVAHNTYITGGLGVGQAETTAGNITGTGRLSITSTTATSTLSTGGLTIGSSQFVVQQTSGNVGIGTTSPNRSFHIFRDSGTATLKLEFAGIGNPRMTLVADPAQGGRTYTLYSTVDQNSVGGGRLVFEDEGESNPIVAARMVLTGSGRLGIGTTTPGGLLSVSGGTTSPIFLLNQTSTGDLVTLQDNGVTAFIVKDGGNVGVGTTSPAQLLSIAGHCVTGDTRPDRPKTPVIHTEF